MRSASNCSADRLLNRLSYYLRKRNIYIVVVKVQVLLLALILSSTLLAPSGRRCGYQCKSRNFVDSHNIIDEDALVH